MSVPKVSVVMSVLNGQGYISQAIDSIRKQTFEDFEFIIVDDGSTDSTWDILQAHAALDSRIIAIKVQENIGTSRALNVGLERATGQFIVRQDADDWSSPERFSSLVTYLDDHPEVGLVGSRANLVNEEGKLIKIGFEIRDNDEIQNTLLDTMCLCGPSIMVRRSHFEDAGFYFANDLSYSEDYDLCLRIAEVTSLHNLDYPLYTYRQHHGSVSIKFRFRQMMNKAIALERALFRRYGANPPDELKAMLARDYLRAAVLGHRDGASTSAWELMEKILSIKVDVFDTEEPLAQIIHRYAPDKQPQAIIHFADDLFCCLLPKNQKTKALKNKILAKYHVASAFELADQKQPLQAVRQLAVAIRKDPAWLKNRGVRSMLVKLGSR